jgi:hypothetical protein
MPGINPAEILDMTNSTPAVRKPISWRISMRCSSEIRKPAAPKSGKAPRRYGKELSSNRPFLNHTFHLQTEWAVIRRNDECADAATTGRLPPQWPVACRIAMLLTLRTASTV